MTNRLNNMLEQLSKYHKETETLMQTYVSERLDKAFAVYDKELQQSIQILTRKHEKSIVKRMRSMDR